MDTITRPKIGDEVGVDDPAYPGVWIVKKLNPKRAALEPKSGGRGLSAPYSMLTSPPANGHTPYPFVAFVVGEFVRVDDPKHSGLYVVIGESADKVRLAKAGGDGNRYLRWPRTSRRLTKVDAAEVLQ